MHVFLNINACAINVPQTLTLRRVWIFTEYSWGWLCQSMNCKVTSSWGVCYLADLIRFDWRSPKEIIKAPITSCPLVEQWPSTMPPSACWGLLSHRSTLSLRSWPRMWMPWAGNAHSFSCLTAFRATPSHPDPFCLWRIRMLERLPTVDCCLIVFERIAKMTSGQATGPIRPSLSETISNPGTFPNRDIFQKGGIEYMHVVRTALKQCLRVTDLTTVWDSLLLWISQIWVV